MNKSVGARQSNPKGKKGPYKDTVLWGKTLGELARDPLIRVSQSIFSRASCSSNTVK